jgi:hypothetical protein
MALALSQRRNARRNCEAVMWRITGHGFTLQEVLIMAAMNVEGRSQAGRANRGEAVAQ